MQSESTGGAGGLWLTVIGICMGLGFSGGYLVAANQAAVGLKKKEADWSAKSKAYTSQAYKQTTEVAALKSTLTNRDKELDGLRQRWEGFKKAREGFSSIKHDVAAGQFQGLESTSGFQILSATFETSEPEN